MVGFNLQSQGSGIVSADLDNVINNIYAFPSVHNLKDAS